jgi:hypothetical protein
MALNQKNWSRPNILATVPIPIRVLLRDPLKKVLEKVISFFISNLAAIKKTRSATSKCLGASSLNIKPGKVITIKKASQMATTLRFI